MKVDGNAVDTALSYTITNVQKDTTITAEFSPISYTISYNLDGGTVSNPTSYTIETESFTLNEPTREGYTFTGWTGSNGTTAQKEVTINKGSAGDRSYTANWITNNVAPTTPTVTTSNKTTSSFVVSAVSTDTDGDSLTYTLYVGGSAKETKTASSGTTVTFSTVTGLSEYTTYSYYVTVTDGKATATSSTGSIRTKCSGQTYSNSSECNIKQVDCNSCDGVGHDSCSETLIASGVGSGYCSKCKKYYGRIGWKCSKCGFYAYGGSCDCNFTYHYEVRGYSVNSSYDTEPQDFFENLHKENGGASCTECDGSSVSYYYCTTHNSVHLKSYTQKHCTHGYTSQHD